MVEFDDFLWFVVDLVRIDNQISCKFVCRPKAEGAWDWVNWCLRTFACCKMFVVEPDSLWHLMQLIASMASKEGLGCSFRRQRSFYHLVSYMLMMVLGFDLGRLWAKNHSLDFACYRI